MKRKAVVLGCGLVGATMARDLAADPAIETTAVDRDETNLRKLEGVTGLSTRRADLASVEQVGAIVRDADVVVGALPSALGFPTLKAVIASGKPYVDISFMIEDGTELDVLAKRNGMTAVVDCGVAPGLANMIIGRVTSSLDETRNVVFYVGGLPRERRWPFEYKACFAPSDVLEEYTRPCRMRENGRIVVKPALSETERIDFPGVGTLEAFNTDGLRSLLETIDASNMKEKTLRYPGHAELMRVFRETGLFGKEEIEAGGVRVRPLDVISALMFPTWRLEAGQREFTLLRVIVEGSKDGRPVRRIHDLYDETDPVTGDTSMARTTGFPCVIVARMLLDGTFDRPGVFPPEILGREPGLLERVTEELARRGVALSDREEERM